MTIRQQQGRSLRVRQIAERRYLPEGSMANLYETDNDRADTKEMGTNTKGLLAG